MGNFNLTIRGVGIHHNQRPDDVEQMAADFVDKLRAAGHTIVAATVTTGGEIDVADRAAGLLPIADVDVIVNGRACKVPGEASYYDIIRQAGYHTGRTLSVTFRGAHEERPEGVLSPNEKVRVRAGTVFNVADTSGA